MTEKSATRLSLLFTGVKDMLPTSGNDSASAVDRGGGPSEIIARLGLQAVRSLPAGPRCLVKCSTVGDGGTAVGHVAAASIDARIGQADSPLALTLLNGFELTCDGAQVLLPMAGQRLVAFLALRDRALLRVYVASSLWLDTDEERSRANLRRTLWRLRRPGCAIVRATATHVSLHPDVVVDVHQMVCEVHRASDGNDDERPFGLDDPSAFEGDLLPDWYDQWLEPERDWLRQLRLHACERAAERALIQGRPAHAVDIALNALRTEPLRESLHALVIRAHLAHGNRGSAIHHYDAYAARIAAQLGLPPSPGIQRLLHDCPAAQDENP